MHQSLAQQANTTVAPDPARKQRRSYWVFVGTILTLGIGSFFLPTPLREELVWNQPSLFSPFQVNIVFSLLFPVLVLAIFVYPFVSFPVVLWQRWKWSSLETKRKHAVEQRLNGRVTATFPLLEVFPPFPATVSLRLCRNWRSTAIAGTIYTILIGLIVVTFVSDWQSTLLTLAQRGELSGWALLGSLFDALFYCLLIFPALWAFLLAPRQRLIATQDGLACYRGLSFTFISWHEAQLFAVIAKQTDTLVYELSTTTSLIRLSSKPTWNSSATFPAATVGIAPLGLIRAENSTEEYQWYIRLITAMVAAGTGLPLSDLHEQTTNRSSQ